MLNLPLWTMESMDQESLVHIEDSSAESWNDQYNDLFLHSGRIRNPKKISLKLLRKIEEVGCSDKNCAWNIAEFIGFCLSDMCTPVEFDLSLPFEHFLFLFTDDANLFKGTSLQLHKIRLPTSEVMFSKFLLNYGFVKPVDIDCEFNLKEVETIIRSFVSEIFEIEKLTYRIYSNIEKKIDQLDLLRSSNGDLNDAFQRGFKRIILIANCIPMLEKTDRRSKTAEQYAQCLRLYFRGVSDPFVQAEEVREFMTFFFVEASEDSVDTMVTVFRSLFPESEAPYRPRSLQHLCRCQVRTVLSQKSEVLPELLNSLKIPRLLKLYILGDL